MLSYAPFNNLCPCGDKMHPIDELYPDNTEPTMREKQITVIFYCENCMNTVPYVYNLPRLTDDISKNVIHYISKEVYEHDYLLEDGITLTYTKAEQPGLAWALGDLQQKGVICSLQECEDCYTFQLCILGWLLIWHGPY